MAKAYNEMNPKNKIKLFPKLETLNPKKCKKKLLTQFESRLQKLCDNQMCWLKQPFINRLQKKIKYDLKTNIFRPKGPQGKFTWLNTFDINKVMGQYEQKYPHFKFLGAVPIDVDDLPSYGIKNLNFKQLNNDGIHSLGIVFNLDPHDKPGSHWVAMYSDTKKGQVYYFDSYGTRPEPEIRKIMRRFSNFIKKQNKKLDVRHNSIRHQFKNSECGVYSINFIIRLLNGNSFDEIVNDKTPDNKINECRDVYFT